MRRRRDDDRIRARGLIAALLLAALLVPLSPPAGAQGSAHLAIEPIGEHTARLDTAHLSARFRFNVTNTGDALDYVTIPRSEIRWTDTMQPALGFPSPEFGVSLAPGATRTMWAHVDVAEPRPGTRTVQVPFRSELTGGTEVRTATVIVSQEPAPTHRLVVRVDPPEALVELTDLQRSTRPEVNVQQGPGATTALVAPGIYAVHAHAPGRQSATRIVEVPGDGLEHSLSLGAARWSARTSELTRASVDDSAWLIGASADLSRVITAPMVHSDPRSSGAFVAVHNGSVAWERPFGPVGPGRADAGPFQALDTAAAYSSDGSRAAGFDWNGKLHVLDGATGAELWSTDRSGDRNPLYPASSRFGAGFMTSGAVAFSPNGTLLAAGGSNGWLVMFDAASGEALWTRAYDAEIRALRFSPNGEALVVGSGDWRIHLLDARTAATRWSADDPEFWPFFFLAMSEDGELLATGGKDSVYRVWNATDGTLVRAIDVFPAFVTGGAIGPWGGTFSDWVYGARGFDANGSTTWFRRFEQAVAATSDDGRFTLVGWYRPGTPAAGLALLDETGTTVWTAPPNLTDACTSTASPFPARQIKSVLLTQPTPTTLRFAAACIGGGVLTGELELHPLDPATPPPPPRGTPTPALTPPAPTGTPPPPPTSAATPPPTTPRNVGTTPSPVATPSATAQATPEEPDADTPGAPVLAWIALAAFAARTWRRRGRG